MEITDLQGEKKTHDNIFTTEDLHETKEHMSLDSSGERIQVLGVIGMRIARGAYVKCEDVRENSA
jgi:hypothetical protein